MKKLFKSKRDIVLLGILGGIAEYMKVDSTVVRLVFVVFVLITGFFPGIIAYIIAAAIVPDEPNGHRRTVDSETN